MLKWENFNRSEHFCVAAVRGSNGCSVFKRRLKLWRFETSQWSSGSRFWKLSLWRRLQNNSTPLCVQYLECEGLFYLNLRWYLSKTNPDKMATVQGSCQSSCRNFWLILYGWKRKIFSSKENINTLIKSPQICLENLLLPNETKLIFMGSDPEGVFSFSSQK